MQYSYTARTIDGETTAGTLVAEAPEAARAQLREKNLYALSLRPTTSGGSTKARGFSRRRGKTSQRDVLDMTTQLAIMTRAGMDLAGALESLAVQSRNPHLKSTLEEIHNDVSAGNAVSEALKKHVETFGEAYIASIAAGEAAGQLPEVLAQLAQLIRSDLRNRSTVRSLMAYPIILSSISTLMIMGLVGFVLPEFAQVFKDANVELPMLTKILMGVSGAVREHLWLWAGGVILLGAAMVIYRKSDLGRRHWTSLS